MDNDKQTPGNSLSKVNWQLCAICQEATSEALQCPADKKHSDVGAGYKTLLCNIGKFVKLGCMPKELCHSMLDEATEVKRHFWSTRHVGIEVLLPFSTPLSLKELKRDMQCTKKT